MHALHLGKAIRLRLDGPETYDRWYHTIVADLDDDAGSTTSPTATMLPTVHTAQPQDRQEVSTGRELHVQLTSGHQKS